MSENQNENKSEILEERRKAQQDFLELKRMQNGEKTTEKSKEKNETPLDKINNFFFYYKGVVIGAVITAIILAVLVSQCANKTKYDLQLVVYDYKLFSDDQIVAIQTYFEETIPDFNGDGAVNVSVANCSYGVGTSTAEFQQTIINKLQSLIVSDTEAMLFLTSDKGYEFINGIDESNGGLLGDKLYLGSDFYEKCDIHKEYPLNENLCIAVRRINGTLMENKNDAVNSNAVANNVYYIISEKINESAD